MRERGERSERSERKFKEREKVQGEGFSRY